MRFVFPCRWFHRLGRARHALRIRFENTSVHFNSESIPEEVGPDWRQLQCVSLNSRSIQAFTPQSRFISRLLLSILRGMRLVSRNTASRLTLILADTNVDRPAETFSKLLEHGILGSDAEGPGNRLLRAPYPPLVEALIKSVLHGPSYGSGSKAEPLPQSIDEAEIITLLLAHALQGGRLALAEALLQHGPSDNPLLLSRIGLGRVAARPCNAAILPQLMQAFPPSRWVDAVAQATCEAMLTGHVEPAYLLLQAGYNPNQLTAFGNSPLEFVLGLNTHAAGKLKPDSPEALQLLSRLLHCGANPEIISSSGEHNAIHLAVEFRLPRSLRILLNHSKSADLPNEKGFTPLVLACPDVFERPAPYSPGAAIAAAKNARFDAGKNCAEVLLLAGANPDHPSPKDMDTPLHLAVSANRPDLVTLLLRHGANPNLLNKYNLSPIEVTAEADFEKCAVALENAGADLSPLLRRRNWLQGYPYAQPENLGYSRTLATLRFSRSQWEALLVPFPSASPAQLNAMAVNPSLPDDLRIVLQTCLS